MNKEEAIKRVEKYKKAINKVKSIISEPTLIEAIDTILLDYEKQQKEIENLLKAYKQDEKIIQEMAEFIYGNDTIFYLPKDVNTKQEVINYFRKKCKQ